MVVHFILLIYPIINIIILYKIISKIKIIIRKFELSNYDREISFLDF